MKIERKNSILDSNPELVHTSQFDEIELDYLIAYLESGDAKDVPIHLVAYIEILEKIWGMSRQLFNFPNNQAIINHLMITYNLKRPKAMQLVKDALTYFHRENMLSNEVWRGILADNGMKSFVAALRVAKNARDFKDAFWILLELGKYLGWNEKEENTGDDDFMRQLQIITGDITMFGFEKANRKELATFIDSLPDVPEKMKELAKKEVDSVPFEIIFSPDNPRKNE